MNTVPKITKEHMEKATNSFKWDERYSVDICNKAIEIALAEQQESEYITATQARELGAGNAEYQSGAGVWKKLDHDFYTHASVCDDLLKYRAIKQAQPEPVDHVKLLGEIYGFLQSICPEGIADEAFRIVPESLRAQAIAKYVEPRDKVGERVRHTPEAGRIEVDPHAALRAEYQKQVAEGTTGFYLWEFQNTLGGSWKKTEAPNIPAFYEERQYRCTDISCYVSKDGEPAIRMLRTEAQELQRKTKDTHDWFMPNNLDVGIHFEPTFRAEGTYTYHTKSTVKLDGNMVTPEQAAAERDAKKDTHELWYRSDRVDWCIWFLKQLNTVENRNEHYELRPKHAKAVAWAVSREDVLALLKEKGLL